MIVIRQIIAMIHQRRPRTVPGSCAGGAPAWRGALEWGVAWVVMARSGGSAARGEEVLTRRREDVDQRPFVERHDAVGLVRAREEAIARDEGAAVVADGHVESPRGDVRDLSVRVVMLLADGVGTEVDAHHHEVRPVAEDLAAHALAHFLPGGSGGGHEGGAPGARAAAHVRLY